MNPKPQNYLNSKHAISVLFGSFVAMRMADRIFCAAARITSYELREEPVMNSE
jgi:hypothetical protein